VQLVSVESTDIDINILERRDDILLYTHDPGVAEMPGYSVSEKYQLQVFLDLIRHFLGRHWVPDEMGLESSSIPPIMKEQLPGCRILTQQIASYIAVPRSCLHRSVLPWDAKIGNAENPLMSEKTPVLTSNFDYMDTLRAVIMPYLCDGYPSQQIAAELMNTSVRTLTRKLHDHGLTYGKLIDELRFNMAKKLLQQPNMRIGEVAQYIGFKDQGDFTRMIRRVAGLTPTKLRDSLRKKRSECSGQLIV
jgi:AraC-like DNA-binding protein